MQRGGNVAKARSIRRAELLLLEIQKDILEYRIRSLEKQPTSTDRGLKRELPFDRKSAPKKPKHEVTTMTVEEMFTQCSKLLTQLKKNNNSGPFLAPVDPIALNCPDYFKIVKKPMDFKTIATRLRPAKRMYKSPLDFRDDVRQVFKNCSLYNPVGNQIRIMGDRLSEYFETLWMKSNIEKIYLKTQPGLKRGRNGDAVDETGRSKKLRMHDTAYNLRKLNGIQNKMQELIQKAKEKMSVKEIDAEAPVTFWQKRKLNAALEKRNEKVIKALAKVWPEKPESMEVGMDDMDDATLRRLWISTKPTSTLEMKEADDIAEEPEGEIMIERTGREVESLEAVKTEEEGTDDVTVDVKSVVEDVTMEDVDEKPTINGGDSMDDGGDKVVGVDQPIIQEQPLVMEQEKTSTFMHPESTVDTGVSSHSAGEHLDHPFVAEAFGSMIPVDSGRVEAMNEPTAGEATIEELPDKVEGEMVETEAVQQVGSSEVEKDDPMSINKAGTQIIDDHSDSGLVDVNQPRDCHDDTSPSTQGNKGGTVVTNEDQES